jgi:superfamily II DNA or RNA helicase
MAEEINVEQINAVHLKISTESSIKFELETYFKFQPSGYQFNPSYRNKVWDGYIRIFSPMRPVLYVGLFAKLKKFAEDRGYILNAPSDLMEGDDIPDDYGYQIAEEINCKFQPRDYQNKYIVDALRSRRSLSLSPTSSGKSLIIYLIQQHYYQAFEHRTLIIVPTISLVHQMAGDFIDYGCDPDTIYKIQGGVDRNTNANVVISTWQSLIKAPKDWFDQFNVVLGDEAHLFQAKSLQKIMEGLNECY